MKFKILTITAAFILSASIFTSAQEAEYPKSLTLDEAVEYALKNHTSVIAAESNVAQYEAQRKEANDNYKKNRYNSFANNMYATFNDLLIKKGVNYFAANASYEVAKASFEQTKYSVAMGVESAYIAYINAGTKLKITSEAFETAKARYNNEITEKQLGLSSDFEIMVAKNTLAKSESNYNAALRAQDLSLAKLKAATGLPIEAETVFVNKTVKLPDIPDITLEKAISLAKENNISIKSAKLQLEVKEASFSAADAWYAKNTYTYKNSLSALEAARDAFASALAQAEMNVYTAYDNMMSTIDNAAILRSSAELAEKTYEIDKQKYELGLISKLDLDESWYETQSIKLQVAELDNAVYAAIKQFEMSYSY